MHPTFVGVAPLYQRRRCAPQASARKRPNSSGKGFGNTPTPPPPPPSSSSSDNAVSSTTPQPSGYKTAPDAQTLRREYERLGIAIPDDSTFGVTRSASDADGDDYDAVAEGDGSGTLPEVVAARMGRRMAGFAGVPFVLLFLFFGGYFVLTYRFEVRVIPAVVAYTTLSLIGLAGVGITYGIMSSSWDPDVEGSRLGWKEAQLNFFRARDALLGQKRREEQDDEFDRIDRLAKKARKNKGAADDDDEM